MANKDTDKKDDKKTEQLEQQKSQNFKERLADPDSVKKSQTTKTSPVRDSKDEKVNNVPKHLPQNISNGASGNVNAKEATVGKAPASQSINGLPVANQYADQVAGHDPFAVLPENHPSDDNVRDLQDKGKNIDHRKDTSLSYSDAVEAAGLQEGDMVRVLRRPVAQELAEWGGVWPNELDQTIGRKYVVGTDDGAKGFAIDIGDGRIYYFPVYSLQKVVS